MVYETSTPSGRDDSLWVVAAGGRVVGAGARAAGTFGAGAQAAIRRNGASDRITVTTSDSTLPFIPGEFTFSARSVKVAVSVPLAACAFSATAVPGVRPYVSILQQDGAPSTSS